MMPLQTRTPMLRHVHDLNTSYPHAYISERTVRCFERSCILSQHLLCDKLTLARNAHFIEKIPWSGRTPSYTTFFKADQV